MVTPILVLKIVRPSGGTDGTSDAGANDFRKKLLMIETSPPLLSGRLMVT